MHLLRGVFAVGVLLFMVDAGAVCIYNATGYTVDFKQTHGHKKAMTARLPPNSHSCRQWNHPTLNVERKKNSTLGFYISFYDKSLAKSQQERETELRAIFRAARKGVPVQPITELPPTRFVCKKGVSASGSITVIGGPGRWECLVGQSEAMHEAAQRGGGDELALPQSMGDCNADYHQCAADARRCQGDACPTVGQCLRAYEDCSGYLQSLAPPPAHAEPEFVEPEEIYWGAAANHHETPYFAWDYASAREAEASALSYCKKQNPRSPDACQLEISFRDCAAAAFPHHGDELFWVEAANLREAKREVATYCREETGDSCHVNWSFCANGDGGSHNKLWFYGSIAKPKRGKTPPAMVTNFHRSDFARMNALRRCKNQSNDGCSEVVNFVTCAAYAESKDRVYYGWSRRESLSQAKRAALNHCRKTSGQTCQVAVSGCNRGFK